MSYIFYFTCRATPNVFAYFLFLEFFFFKQLPVCNSYCWKGNLLFYNSIPYTYVLHVFFGTVNNLFARLPKISAFAMGRKVLNTTPFQYQNNTNLARGQNDLLHIFKAVFLCSMQVCKHLLNIKNTLHQAYKPCPVYVWHNTMPTSATLNKICKPIARC